MKALLVTNPSPGHIFPMFPVAQAMQEAGHEVAFATAAALGPLVESRAFRAFAAGMDWTTADAERFFPQLRAMAPDEQDRFYLADVFADSAAHAMLPDLLNIMRDWRPDIVLRNDREFASPIAAEVLDIPHATISTTFFLPNSLLGPLINDQLAFLRSGYGLAPYPALDMLYPHLYLSFAPLSLQPIILPVMRALRPLPIGRFGSDRLPEWFRELPDQPLVYASMGSDYHVTDIFPLIIEALGEEPVNLIITVGRDHDPADYGPQPANVRIERFIPQTLLFPHCAAFINHAPFAPMMLALSHSVPLLLAPIAANQIVAAQRAADLGLGRVLRRPELDPTQFHERVPVLTPASIRAALRTILGTPSYRASAQRMQHAIHAMGGAQDLLALLGQLAARQPIAP